MKNIFVNGSFDILHVGHIELLNYARSFGNNLTVGIDSDCRVKKLKGENRPFNNQEDRKKMLLALKSVDYVKIFYSDEDLKNLINYISPDIMIVGIEYKNKKVIGSEHAKQLKFFNKIHGYSTTSTIQNITIG